MLSNPFPEVSIVIISWKMKDMLDVCLGSIYTTTQTHSFEIIVIDNASKDGTKELISEKYPNVIYIENSENLGVAPARNKGLPIAKGQYTLILDADIKIVNNALDRLVDFLDSNQSFGMVGAKLCYPDMTPQANCKRFPTLSALLLRRIEHTEFAKNHPLYRNHIMSEFNHDQTIEVDYLIGACQMFRTEILKSVGLLDDKIFYGPEDIDFCLRIRSKGWKIGYLHEAIMIHYEQRITKRKLFSLITFKHLLGLFYIFHKYNGRLHPTRVKPSHYN